LLPDSTFYILHSRRAGKSLYQILHSTFYIPGERGHICSRFYILHSRPEGNSILCSLHSTFYIPCETSGKSLSQIVHSTFYIPEKEEFVPNLTFYISGQKGAVCPEVYLLHSTFKAKCSTGSVLFLGFLLLFCPASRAIWVFGGAGCRV
jgi:hypothetical protein